MLLAALDQAISDLALEGRHVLVAVSGGLDSTVLLEGLARLAASRALTLSVGHVNHGLRAGDADADERAVHQRAARLGLKCSSERVDPRALRVGTSNRVRPTLQEAARNLRYDALRSMATRHRAASIATAHNLDDQAETVLMRLFRGTGPSGLGGIPERSPDGVVVRPLLGVSRQQIAAYAAEVGLEWREDLSNASDAYTRNRLRRHWIPELARAFNPQLLRSIGRLADSQRKDAEWIAELVDSAARRLWSRKEPEEPGESGEGRSLEITRGGWEHLPEALALRLARRAMVEMGAGRDVSRVHLQRIWHFLSNEKTASGAELELPGGLRLTRVREGYRMWQIGVDPQGPC